MANLPPTFKPVNRHLSIVPHFPKKEEERAVLLPEGYEPAQERYIVATVVDVAPDCSDSFRRMERGAFHDKLIIVDSSMIEEIKIKNKVNYIILENYVVGLLRGHS